MGVGARRGFVGAVTVARGPIALVLPVAPPSWRWRLFAAGAVTDVVDGPLARRLGVAGEAGARLDTIADAVFVAGSTIAVLDTVAPSRRPTVVAGAAVVAATRLVALIVTRRRFGRWSVVHTDLNRATGLLLAVVAASALARRRASIAGLIGAGAIGLWSALDELAIVATADDYDADRRRR